MPKDQRQSDPPAQPGPSEPAAPYAQVVVAADGQVYEEHLEVRGELAAWVPTAVGSPEWQATRRTYFWNHFAVDLSESELKRAAAGLKSDAAEATRAVTFQRVSTYERPEVLGSIAYEGENAITYNPPVPHVRVDLGGGDGWGVEIGPSGWNMRHQLSAAGMAFRSGHRFLNARRSGRLAPPSRRVIEGPTRMALERALHGGLRNPAVKGATAWKLLEALDGPGVADDNLPGDGLRMWSFLAGCATQEDWSRLCEFALRALRGRAPFRPLFIRGTNEASARNVVDQLVALIDPPPAQDAEAVIDAETALMKGARERLLAVRYLVPVKLEDGVPPGTLGYDGTITHLNDQLGRSSGAKRRLDTVMPPALAHIYAPVLTIEGKSDPATGQHGHRPVVVYGAQNVCLGHLDLGRYDVVELGGPLEVAAVALWPRAKAAAFASLGRVIRAELYDAVSAGLYAEANGMDPVNAWLNAPGHTCSAADLDRVGSLVTLAVLAAEIEAGGRAASQPHRPRRTSALAPAGDERRPPEISHDVGRTALADPVVRVIALELLGWLALCDGFSRGDWEPRTFAPKELAKEIAARAPKGSLDKLQNGGRLNDKGIWPYLDAPERRRLLAGIGIDVERPAGHGKKRRIILRPLRAP